MTDNDIRIAGEKAKSLREIKDKGLLQEQMKLLKEMLRKNGLHNGIMRLQIFAENKENENKILSSIEFTDKGSMLYYTELFSNC